MFQGENASSAEGKVIVEVKTIITNVNVATRNRITKDHVF
jgi:hypothetical protein